MAITLISYDCYNTFLLLRYRMITKQSVRINY